MAGDWPERFADFLVGNVSAEGEQRGYCPICEDPEESASPSGSFNWDKGVFHCASGKSCGGFSLKDLWSMVLEDRGVSDPPDRRNVRGIGTAKSRRARTAALPTEEEISGFVDALLASPPRLKVMKEKRGLSLKTIKKFQIGWYQERYTIPIRDAEGVLMNVRRYKPDAKLAKDKMVSWAVGVGERRLFLPGTLAEETVILTEGELDAIIGQQYGFSTMSHTAGASAWQKAWNPYFEGKTVYICYDVDDAGRQGAKRVAHQLSKVARAVYLVNLPLTRKSDDLTNYFVDQGYTAGDFQALLDQCTVNPYKDERAKRSVVGQEPLAVTLEGSQSSEHGNRPLSVVATIAGKVQPAYMMPKRVEFTCDMDWGDRCKTCDMAARGGTREITVVADDVFLLELVDKNKDQADKLLKKRVEAPPTCPRLEYEQTEQWNVEELVAIQAVDARTEDIQNPIQRRVYNVGAYGTPINTKAKLVGVNTPDPRNQRGVLQAWQCEQMQTDLDQFTMTPELREDLLIFQPKDGQSPLEKMEEIADDLEANVTKIYGRRELHMAYDLVWHSLMDFRFAGTLLGKGWLELLVVGDTRTGKSEAATRLITHYQAGVLKSCEGATLAGLVGGAQQVGSSWMVMWGTIPLNDRRLVVLDEFSGISDKGIIEQMSSVRSSGRAQITKIVSQETSARTRLIWIGNPEDGRSIEEMPRGAIEAIRTLVHNPEDIARFDLAMSAASADVKSSIINTSERAGVAHRYTEDLCSALVSWVWSRKVEDVVWATGVENYILERAEAIGGRYVPEPPLIQAENVRVKLARMAAAIAGRTFSCDKTGTKVVITEDHVDSAEELLERLYSMPSFGYRAHSRKVLRDRDRAEGNRKRCRKWLVNHRDSAYVALQAVVGNDFKVRDFCEFAGMSQDEAQTSVRDLQEMKMVRRMNKGYIRMDPALVNILKQLEEDWDDD